MDYNAHMIARAEHQHMVKSLPIVSEYGQHLSEPKHNQRHLRWVGSIIITMLSLLTK
jgi:hypothetical protein